MVDDRICRICDGGPGNDGPCLCGARRWNNPDGKTCGECEYFDRHHGDCLRSSSPRFQAEPDTPACHLFCPDTTADAGRAALEQGGQS